MAALAASSAAKKIDFVSLSEAWKASKVSIVIFIFIVVVVLAMGVFVVLLILDDAGKFEFESNRHAILGNKLWVVVFTIIASVLLVLSIGFFIIYLFFILPAWIHKAESSELRLDRSKLLQQVIDGNDTRSPQVPQSYKQGRDREFGLSTSSGKRPPPPKSVIGDDDL